MRKDLLRNLSFGWNGVLPSANGGTNIASYAVGDLLYASGATTLSKLADVAVGSYLRSGGVTTAPLWSTLLLPNAATANYVPFATSTNTWGESANFTYNTNRLSPTYLTLAAGTATAGTCPLVMTSGPLLTTAIPGGIELLTDKYYATITTGAARMELALNNIALTSGRVVYTTTNGRLRDSSSLTYNGIGLTIDTSGFYGTAGGLKIAAGASSTFYIYQQDVSGNYTYRSYYGHFWAVSNSNVTVMNLDNSGNLGIGTSTVSARLHSLSTTEQLRLGYDVSNYASFTTSSAGVLTIAPTGARAAFTKPVALPVYTVATLPAGTQGDTAYASDLLAPTFLAVAVGGGAVQGIVSYNGAAWQVG